MEKVIVLGAGRGQIPLINLLHKYGYYVVAVSPQGNYPGIALADEVVYIDIREKKEVLSIALKNSIKAIVTDQLDEGVLTAAYVAERMGLKGIGIETAKKFTDKFVMRQSAEKIGIAVPANICAYNKAEAIYKARGLRYPLMLKPADSSASKGVYKVISEEELSCKFDDTIQYSKSGKVIIEEFIEGQEYVVDAYTHGGKTKNLIVGYRNYFNIKDTFIPNSTIFYDANTANDEVQNRLKEINIRLVEGFGLSFGITHAEYLYNQQEDKIYLVEIAARGGGVFISSDLIPMASGVNANELLIKDVLGLDIMDKDLELTKGVSAYFCCLLPEGEVTSLEGIEDIYKIENVEKVFFDNINMGLKITSIKDKSSRKGPVLVKTSSIKECYETFEKIKEQLKVKIKTKNGVEFAIWH